MVQETIKTSLELFIEHTQQGQYLTLPFTMPFGTETMTLCYEYERQKNDETRFDHGIFTNLEGKNIVDLGLIAPNGKQVGASGSDKLEILVSEARSTPGYNAVELTPGEWKILAGAYKIAPEGVRVTYHLEFKLKARQLYLGDLHTHTLASDGVLTAEELGRHARRHGLDFIAITDHNQMISQDALPQIDGLTIIPGIEWTHYQGHANFLGVDRPYDKPFYTNDIASTQAIFDSARDRGALIVVNHPFEEICPFKIALEQIPFDLLEVWNGPMRESNLKAIGFWQQLLVSGKKIPICGGSDYHRDRLFQILGGPTVGVYARSTSKSDVLRAVRQGHSFITFSPEGPLLNMFSGSAIMGDSLVWNQGQVVNINIDRLEKGDLVRVVTQTESIDFYQAPTRGNCQLSYPITAPGFVRVEVWRTFLPGIPPLPALISNPIYLDKD